MTGTNGRVTMAILKTEVAHVKESINELKDNTRQIMAILNEGNGKISSNREKIVAVEEASKEGITWTRWVLGTGIVIAGVVATVVGAML